MHSVGQEGYGFLHQISLGITWGWLPLTAAVVPIGLGWLIWRLLSAQSTVSPQATQEADLYQRVVESQTDLICVAQPDTTIIFVNQAYCHFFGVERQAMVGYRWIESPTLSPTPQQETLARLQALSPAQPTTRAEHRSADAQGQLRWLSWIDTGIFDARGQLTQILSVGRDITAQKQMEADLRLSEARLRDLLNAVPDLLVLVDRQGNYLYFRPPSSFKILHPPEHYLGKNLRDIRPPGLVDQELQFITEALDTGQIQHYEYQLDLDNTKAYREVRITPFGEDEVLVIIRDITERKEAEQILGEQWQFLHRVLDSMPYRCYVRDQEGNLLLLNQQAVKTSLLTKGQLIGRKVEVETGNPLSPICQEEIRRIIRAQHPLVLAPKQFPMPDGSRPWLRMFKIPVEIPGRGQGILISAIDVTEEIQIQETLQSLFQRVQSLNSTLEEKVRERTQQLQQALEFSALLRRISDQIRSSLDEAQIFQSVVEELRGALCLRACRVGVIQSNRQLQIRSESSDFPDVHRGNIYDLVEDPENQAIYRQLSTGHPIRRCLALHVLSPMTVIEFPILDKQGLIGTLILYRDPREEFEDQEIQLAEQVADQCAIALRQSYLYRAAQLQVQELEQLNQLKDDFLSTISHELRTPLTNMRMSIHMLQITEQKFPLQSKQRQYLRLLEQECRREIELINDLLSLQQLDGGRYPFTPEPLDLDQWLPQILQGFSPRLQERDLQVEIQIPDPLPKLQLDSSSLERIVRELFTNACKYTPPGQTIRLTAQILKQEQPRLQLTLSNPAEIPAEMLPKLFDRFYRAPQSDRWKQGGTGLGLALVKGLVEGLQGTIRVSVDQGWITFTLQLPMADLLR